MRLFDTILNALFPTVCVGCGEVLVGNERQLCLHCLNQLSYTGFSRLDTNPAEALLMGIPHFRGATALLHYGHGDIVQHIVHSMKFHGNSELCLMMGRQMGLDLLQSARFDDVDLLLPVPLHPLRRLRRGYNQSQLLCQGIAAVFPRPVDTTSFRRSRYTRKQSLQHVQQRRDNVNGAFRVTRPDALEGRHVLLVDDVLTTGATIRACCDALSSVPGISISVATLTIAGM